MAEQGSYGSPRASREGAQASASTEAPPKRGLPALALALLIGFAGILFISYFTHWYESIVWWQPEEQQLTSIALAPLVIFMVFLLLVVLNPILHLFLPWLKLGRRELILIVAMWLITAVISYTSFANPIVLTSGIFMSPHTDYGVMKDVGYKSYLPSAYYLNTADANDFLAGLGEGMRHIPVGQVPWRLWIGPLAFWIPLMLVAIVLSSTLVQIVHRQWSKHELLAYPIADVMNMFISQEKNRAFPDVFYRRGFWVGFAITAFVFTLNDLKKWFPLVPGIQLGFWYSNLVREFPFLAKYCCEYAFSLFRLLIHPYVIALAVLLPLDVSLTCWLGWILMILFTGVNFLFTGDPFPDDGSGHLRAGTYVAIFLVVLIVGWREYVKIVWLAFSFRKTDHPDLRNEAWACRIFVLAFVGLVWLLTRAGMDWLMATLFGCSFVLILLVMARITAEIGIPWLYNMLGSARYLPINALGPAAVGPKSLVVMSLVGGMLDLYPSTTIVANETIYRKMEESQKTGLPRWRFNAVLLLAAIVAIGATVFSQLWNDYSYGAKREPLMGWIPIRDCALATSESINRLKMEGRAEKLGQLSGFAKLGQIKASPKFWRYFLYGFGAVTMCAFMRLRFAWWPLHPLPFLFFNSWVMSRIFFSIFLGWLIKLGLVKIGGGKVFAQSKAFFVGVIMGQIVVSIIFVFVVTVYHLRTGIAPPPGTAITWY